MTYDLVVKDARIVDGTGKPEYRGDVAIQDGVIAEIGEVERAARRGRSTPAARSSRRVSSTRTRTTTRSCCGIPTANPSTAHGITTVLTGNCGYTLAPVRSDDQDYLMGLFAAAEEIPKQALARFAPFGWETFPEYLGWMPGRLGVNVLTQVGHSAVRRFVMGEAALERAATADESRADGRDLRGGDGRGRGGHQQQPGAAPARRARRAHPVVLRRPGRDPRPRRGRAAQGQAPAVDQSRNQARRPERRGPRAARRARRALRRRRVVERLRHGYAERRQRARVHGGGAAARAQDLRSGALPAARDPLHAEEALGDLRQLGGVGRALAPRPVRQARRARRSGVARPPRRVLGRPRASW